MKKLFVFAPFMTAAACNINNSIQTKGYIFERKMLNNGKLMVHYVFNSGKVLLQDSSIIENKVLSQDSVIVEFKKENPNENTLINFN